MALHPPGDNNPDGVQHAHRSFGGNTAQENVSHTPAISPAPDMVLNEKLGGLSKGRRVFL